MEIPAARFRAVVTAPHAKEGYRSPDVSPRATDARGILDVAATMIAADGRVQPEEREAFAVLADEVKRATGCAEEIALAELVQERTPEEVEAHVRALAGGLSGVTARHLAYKVAVALSSCDLSAHDAEYEVDEALVAALGLSADVAESLTAEVHAALIGEDGE